MAASRASSSSRMAFSWAARRSAIWSWAPRVDCDHGIEAPGGALAAQHQDQHEGGQRRQADSTITVPVSMAEA